MNAHNEQQARALAELTSAAGLMLSEIDSSGHEVDPAYRATLFDAWEQGKAALAASPVVKQNLTTQPAAAQEAVDFYVCDSCGHHYMDDGITCDCTGASSTPPLRHVRMAPVTAAPGIDLSPFREPVNYWHNQCSATHGIESVVRIRSEATRLLALIDASPKGNHPVGTPMMPDGKFYDGCWERLPKGMQQHGRMLTQSWRVADSTELKRALEAGVLALMDSTKGGSEAADFTADEVNQVIDAALQRGTRLIPAESIEQMRAVLLERAQAGDAEVQP